VRLPHRQGQGEERETVIFILFYLLISFFIKTLLVSQRAANRPNIFFAIRNQLVANVQREGLRAGLYRGLAPQLIGIAPEKALKLTVNDRLRRFLRGEDQSRDLKLWEEIAAGCGTGCVQVRYFLFFYFVIYLFFDCRCLFRIRSKCGRFECRCRRARECARVWRK
jgi:hypothetical protein